VVGGASGILAELVGRWPFEERIGHLMNAMRLPSIAKARQWRLSAAAIALAAVAMGHLFAQAQAVNRFDVAPLKERNRSVPIAGQSARESAPSLVFEVASIKRHLEDDPGYIRIEPGERFTAVSAPPILLIRQAYGMLPSQFVNIPDWANIERYDVLAKAPDGVEVAPNMPALLRSLLRDRFGFQAHLETRDLPTYDLIIARADGRLGARLQRAPFDCATRKPGTLAPRDDKGESLCGVTGGPKRIIVRGYPLARFAAALTTSLQRIVIDKTGLTGSWNLDLEFTPDQPASVDRVSDAPNDVPHIVTAVQEQLGLKLESSHGPVEVLVIDRLLRPSSN
jgi:uncharacterized protein (TIGR03435 family)